MSAKCQKRTSARQLFDHLVGSGQQTGHRDAERLGGLEVDHQLELGGLYNRQIGRLFAFQNASAVVSCLPIRIGDAGAIAD